MPWIKYVQAIMVFCFFVLQCLKLLCTEQQEAISSNDMIMKWGLCYNTVRRQMMERGAKLVELSSVKLIRQMLNLLLRLWCAHFCFSSALEITVMPSKGILCASVCVFVCKTKPKLVTLHSKTIKRHFFISQFVVSGWETWTIERNRNCISFTALVDTWPHLLMHTPR